MIEVFGKGVSAPLPVSRKLESWAFWPVIWNAEWGTEEGTEGVKLPGSSGRL